MVRLWQKLYKSAIPDGEQKNNNMKHNDALVL